MTPIDPQDRLICLRAGDPLAETDGMVLPPIAQASIFRKQSMEELHEALGREERSIVYSRGLNPTVQVLERTIAALERGEACRCFASGMGAIGALLFGVLKAGDHVLFVNDIYGPTLELARRLEDFGVSHSQVCGASLEEVESALRPETRLIYLESPGSMLFQRADVAGIAAVAKARGILSAIDNTVATPLLQKPLTQGIDFSIHSCSKYIGGHSDAIGGALVGPQEWLDRIFFDSYLLLGARMAPFEAWLFLRGLMTLPARIARHSADALEVARFLARHPAVSRVHHPALDGNGPAHTGLFSFALQDDSFTRAVAVANRLQLFGKAVSWGGAESLVITGHKRDPGRDSTARLPASLIRLSIGLEGAEALIEDLDRALS